ncbi:MAG: type II secretion system protein [Phycisphaerae bacterium]|nr:type II secretion system protein [Phycisphaerae bacterium]
MTDKRGFTLIELLVVISIIAILMAILMPGLQRVKAQAQLTVCRNNLRNYGLTGRMYSDDFDGEFPYSFHWLYASHAGCDWHNEARNLDRHPELAGCLWPYLKGQEINLCPQFSVVAREMGCQSCGKTGSIALKPQYGYTMNSYLNGDGFGYIPSQYQTTISKLKLENQVKEPARTFYFGEENSWSIPGYSSAGINDNNLRALPNGTTDCFATFHRTRASQRNEGTSFAVFVDSHVEEVSPYPPEENPNAPKGNTWQLSWPGKKPAPIF